MWITSNTDNVGDSDSSHTNPDSKVRGANVEPTWVISAPDGPHVGPMNLAICEPLCMFYRVYCVPDIWTLYKRVVLCVSGPSGV